MEELQEFIENINRQNAAFLLWQIMAFLLMIALAWLGKFITRRFFLHTVARIVRRTKHTWDDFFIQRHVFNRVGHLVPPIIIYVFSPVVLEEFPGGIAFLRKFSTVYLIIAGLMVIDALLNAGLDIYRTFDVSRRMPLRGFVQVTKIILYSAAVIIVLSIIMGKPPYFFLGGLGAITAVLILVFRDSILGFVSGIQLATNQMVRIGDWIEVPDFGADGDVIDVTLTTVMVRNFDKTITTVPAHALITGSFKNWRGMKESGGRRIKRAINIDMSSVKICDQKMIDKFRKIKYISEYIDRKLEELKKANEDIPVDEAELINRRRLTNIGTFRAYVVAYLQNHPMINTDMTFLVRQLQPTGEGLPIQIYVFSKEQTWAKYEAIQADIFDHIIAIVPEFGLRIFQYPTGADLKKL